MTGKVTPGTSGQPGDMREAGRLDRIDGDPNSRAMPRQPGLGTAAPVLIASPFAPNARSVPSRRMFRAVPDAPAST